MGLETSSALTPPADRKFRAHWVVYRLHIAASSLRKIAEEEGVTVQAVSDALRNPSSHLEDVIAGKLGLTARQLFPERFDADGSRRHIVQSPNRSTKRAEVARRKGAA